MTIAAAPEIEAIIDRFVLPSAPQALADAVRDRLSKGDIQISAAGSSSGAMANGRPHGPTPVREPWRLLHLARGAPQPIVDIAYQVWQSAKASPVQSPAPRVSTTSAPPRPLRRQAPAAAHVDVRLAQLAKPVEARPRTFGSTSARAYIESASDEHRYGIANQPIRIGADPGCDVVLPQDAPVEARIWPHGERFMLRAVAGKVRVDGGPATLVVLDDGDILEIGDATFRFRLNTML